MGDSGPFIPRVFISYSRESTEHEEQVLALANRLREDGVDAAIDQYVQMPTEGWPLWMEEQIERANFVLVVCTREYSRRARSRTDAKHKGVPWEFGQIRTDMYESKRNEKFVPVFLKGAGPADIPRALRGATYYDLSTDAGYWSLYRLMTNQPETLVPEIGSLKPLSPKRARSYAFSTARRSKSRKSRLLDPRIRTSLIERVRRDWIEGFLAHSLGNADRIQLRLEHRPAAVDNGWDVLVQPPQGKPDSLARDTKLVTIFDLSCGALMILGAPGSGKTTLLLELTNDLLQRAASQNDYPVAVYFNLASWSDSAMEIVDWLAAEMHLRYQIPFAVAYEWIQQDGILPLLDGLDEVPAYRREACVAALNRFRSGHGLLPIAVCSRLEEYEMLSLRLRLSTAVVIKPLSLSEIRECLLRLGPPAHSVVSALEGDVALKELFQTPLMLSVAAHAYAGEPAREMAPLEEAANPQQQLLSTFVQQMLGRRGHDPRYADSKTMKWLAWLAHSLTQHNQSMFQLDSFRPHWLPTRMQRVLVEFVCVGVLSLVFGLFFGVVVHGALAQNGVLYPRIALIGLSTVGGLMVLSLGRSLYGGWFVELYWKWNGFSWRRAWVDLKHQGFTKPFFVGLGYSSVVWLVYVLMFRSDPEFWSVGWVVCLAVVIVATPVSALVYALIRSSVIGAELGRVHATWPTVSFGWKILRRRILAASVVWLLTVVVFAYRGAWIAGFAFSSMIVWWLGLGFDEVRVIARPEDRIVQAGRTGACALSLFCVTGLICDLAGLPKVMGTPWTLYGFLLGLANAAYGGGLFLVQHALIRILLWLQDYAPFQYSNFLEYVTGRILLRRAGGTYIFVHRLVMEYFASCHVTQERRAPSRMTRWLSRPAISVAVLVLVLIAVTLGIERASRHANIRILSEAIAQDDVAAFRRELKWGYDSRSVNAREGTPKLKFLMHTSAAAGETEIVLMLLDTGVRVDLRDENGMTALTWAILGNQVSTVQALIARGASVDITPRLGQYLSTPLLMATTAGNQGIAALLLHAGASPNGTVNGISPLGMAVHKADQDLTTVLLSGGATVDVRLVQAVAKTGPQSMTVLLTEHLGTLANRGDTRSQVKMALLYEHGIAVGRDYGQALHWLRKAAETGGAQELNDLAWRLATLPESTYRNGPEAVRLAEQAVRATSFSNENIVDTLAAAYAETGDWKNAVSTQQRAITMLKNKKDEPEAETTLREFTARRERYLQYEAYREQP